MNHREMVLGRGKTARFKFLTLPEELQDEIVAGIDSRKLTFLQGEQLARGRGHPIADTGIHAYYKALSLERQKHAIAAPLFEGLAKLSAQEKVHHLMKICMVLLAKLYLSEGLDPEKLKEGVETSSRLTKALRRSFRLRRH
jgi:hypothetical protein